MKTAGNVCMRATPYFDISTSTILKGWEIVPWWTLLMASIPSSCERGVVTEQQ